MAYSAPPASQGELLLYELTRARETLYLSTNRTDAAVEDAFERTTAPTGDPRVRFISGDDPLGHVSREFRNASSEDNLIIDPIDVLERSERARYQNFLNELQNHMQNTGGLAMLYCLDGESVPPLRDMTNHIADVILDLQVTTDGSEVTAVLAVPKFRGGRAPNETLTLELDERVRIDTSRDIA